MNEKPEKAEKPVPPAASAREAGGEAAGRRKPGKTAGSPTAPPARDDAWRPRIEPDRELHGFGGNTPEADSILESPRIRHPDEDTAPLQGSHDRSDEDSLDDEGSPDER